MDERQPAQQRRDAGQRGRTGRFASPLGAALGKPDEAPYLDIVYGPRPAVAPRYVARRPTAPATFGVSPHVAGPRVAPRLNDSNLTSIYGVSGSFSSDTVCSTYACGGAINVATVAGGGAPLDGAYIRIGVTLTCAGLTSPTHSYWASSAPNNGNNSDIPTVIRRAATFGLIPIINFLHQYCFAGHRQRDERGGAAQRAGGGRPPVPLQHAGQRRLLEELLPRVW